MCDPHDQDVGLCKGGIDSVRNYIPHSRTDPNTERLTKFDPLFMLHVR